MLVGITEPLTANWTNLLLWLLPVNVFASWIHAIDLVLASTFLAGYLRARGRSWAACTIGALTAFWVGSNLTLTFAGHIGKYGVLMFAAAFLWTCEQAVRSRKIGWSILSGGALGLMFLEQADLALFFAMVLGPFALYTLGREHGFKLPAMARVLIPMGVTAALVAMPYLLSTFRSNLQSASGSSEEAQAQWEFSTQWSWPPDESHRFHCARIHGMAQWRAGWAVLGPDGPFGRLGADETGVSEF